MTVRYTASYSGLRELMRGPEMQALVRQVAEKGMAFAVGISPERTGEYKSSFEVTVTDSGGINPPEARAEAQLMNTSDHAVNVEWQDGYHVLTRTLGELGGAVTLPGFPDAERAVCDLLSSLGTTGTETPAALQSELPYIRVTRTGGADDLVSDTANVSVDVFAADASTAKATAEACRQRLILGPYRSDASFVTGHGRIDKARTLSGPLSLPPTDSDDLRMVVASYQVSTRR